MKLDYASVGQTLPMEGLFRAAAVCAAAPLVVGPAILLAWRMTGQAYVLLGGVVAALGGLVCVLAAGACLLTYRIQASRTTSQPVWRLSRRERTVAAALLANLPAAIGCILYVTAVMNRYTVLVINATDKPVTHFCLTGTGSRIDCGTIMPHASKRVTVRPNEGAIDFSAGHGERAISGSVCGYFSPGLGSPGANAKVTIRDSGILVQEVTR